MSGGLVIGSRYVPGMHVERRDTALGLFESVMPPLATATEARTQTALLAKVPAYVQTRIDQARRAKRVGAAMRDDFRAPPPVEHPAGEPTAQLAAPTQPEGAAQ